MPALKRKEIDLEPYETGEFTKKTKGFAVTATNPRPEFDEGQFDLRKLKDKTNPPLELFLEVLNLPKNSAVFIQERIAGTGKRRGTIFSILALTEIFYPDLTTGCRTDIACLQHLLESRALTKDNVTAVYTQLNKLMSPVLTPFEEPSKEQVKRSKFLDALDSHLWATERLRVELYKVFKLSERSHLLLNEEREEKREIRLG